MQASSTPPRVPDGRGLRLGLVISRFNETVTTRLRRGAEEALAAAGVLREGVELVEVPGAFELPVAARALAATGRVDAVVCLGCVIRGETPHFEYIASAVAHGLTDVAVATGVPVAFGVLTTHTLEQAEARSGPGPANKGFEAACAAVEMARVLCRLRTPTASTGRRGMRVGMAARSGRAARRAAREAAIQMLYCWEVGGTSLDEALEGFRQSGVRTLDEATGELAQALARGTAACLDRIDPLLDAQAQHWRLERMAVVDRWILRLGAYELLETDTPRAVVINEAVELARTFSTEDAVRFVNGVLDGLARVLAPPPSG